MIVGLPDDWVPKKRTRRQRKKKAEARDTSDVPDVSGPGTDRDDKEGTADLERAEPSPQADVSSTNLAPNKTSPWKSGGARVFKVFVSQHRERMELFKMLRAEGFIRYESVMEVSSISSIAPSLQREEDEPSEISLAMLITPFVSTCPQ